MNSGSGDSMLRKTVWALLLVVSSGVGLSAQSTTPVISGSVEYLSTTGVGETTFQPIISPVIAAPIGDHWLIEARATLDEYVSREGGAAIPFHAQTFCDADYLQLDYIANSHLTVTVGQFLTPFNIYNERLSADWVRNLVDVPLISGIGNQASASSDGAMLRGVLLSRKNWELNYATYFSALVDAHQFDSGRSAGGRAGVFIPRTRLEAGMSYQRFLQKQRTNSWGGYVVWQPNGAPLELRAEYARSRAGQGYWIEGAYRLSKFLAPNHWLRRLQGVARVQQFHLGRSAPGDALSVDVLPTVDTQQADLGLNYYLPHGLRINASYGRQFSSLGDANVWNFQVTYRFLFPLIPGDVR
jgi:hypothetical protein